MTAERPNVSPAPGTRAVLGWSAALAVTGLAAIALELAPLGVSAEAPPSPDLLFLLVAAFVLRRPAGASLPVVAALGLCRDLLDDVPPGAGTLTLVLGAEILRALRPVLLTRGLLAEWLSVALLLAGALVAQWLMVLLLLARPPYLSELALQWALSAPFYPVAALLLRGGARRGGARPRPAPRGA